MISLDTTESYIKYIHDETGSMKGKQPYYNGQLDMKIVSNNTPYDHAVKAGVYTGWNIIVTFTADTQEIPFCEFYVTAMINNPTTQAYANQIIIEPEISYSLRWSSGKSVSSRYNIGYDYANVPEGTNVYVKAYAVASDTGSLTVSAV